MNTWICDGCGARQGHDGRQSYNVAQRELEQALSAMAGRAEKAEARVAELETALDSANDRAIDAQSSNIKLRARVAELEAGLDDVFELALDGEKWEVLHKIRDSASSALGRPPKCETASASEKQGEKTP